MNRKPRWVHDDLPDRPDDGLTQTYVDLFQSEAGQRVLDDLSKQANYPSINASSIDPNQAVWILARQNLITYLINKIEPKK